MLDTSTSRIFTAYVGRIVYAGEPQPIYWAFDYGPGLLTSLRLATLPQREIIKARVMRDWRALAD